jgi:hypothetical protein
VAVAQCLHHAAFDLAAGGDGVDGNPGIDGHDELGDGDLAGF